MSISRFHPSRVHLMNSPKSVSSTELNRHRAARHVLSSAANAEDASLLLSILGLEPTEALRAESPPTTGAPE